MSLLKFLKRSVLLVILLSAIAAGLIVWDGLNDELGTADVAVVLGNRIEKDGTPSERLKGRLDKAVELYGKGEFSYVIVSGGMGKEGFDEAVVMRQYLVDHGIPMANILVDSAGKNTFFTAKNSAHLMAQHGWKSAMVISQFFHISRSRLAMARFGVQRIYAAHADYYEWRDIYSLGREVVAYAYYWIRSYRD